MCTVFALSHVGTKRAVYVGEKTTPTQTCNPQQAYPQLNIYIEPKETVFQEDKIQLDPKPEIFSSEQTS